MIPFHKTSVTQKEIDAVNTVLAGGWLTTGPKGVELESVFSEMMGGRSAMIVNSATSAALIGFDVLGLRGAEVICSTFSFVSPVNMLVHLGAIPVLCDVDYATCNMTVETILEAVTPNTKAVMITHYAGYPCDIQQIAELCEERGWLLIEDCAHCIPTTYQGMEVGSCYSDMAFFSFYATKTVGAGEGGALVFKNPELMARAKALRLHGISRDVFDRYTNTAKKDNWRYEVVESGYKANLTDLHSALALVQIERRFEMLEARRTIANSYRLLLEHVDVALPPADTAEKQGCAHLFPIKVRNNSTFIRTMQEHGVQCSMHFIPIHQHPAYKSTRRTSTIVADELSRTLVSLPIWPDLPQHELTAVGVAIMKTLYPNTSIGE